MGSEKVDARKGGFVDMQIRHGRWMVMVKERERAWEMWSCSLAEEKVLGSLAVATQLDMLAEVRLLYSLAGARLLGSWTGETQSRTLAVEILPDSMSLLWLAHTLA